MDLVTIEAILDQDNSQLKNDGTLIDKHTLISDYACGNRHWEIADSKPIKVTIVGEIGLLFGRWRGKGLNNHQPFDYATCFLAVYRKRGDHLKLLADASLV